MGKDYHFILDRYDPMRPNMGHIYIVANGIVIDPVNPVFNKYDNVWKREKIKGITNSTQIGARTGKAFPLSLLLIALLIVMKK